MLDFKDSGQQTESCDFDTILNAGNIMILKHWTNAEFHVFSQHSESCDFDRKSDEETLWFLSTGRMLKAMVSGQ